MRDKLVIKSYGLRLLRTKFFYAGGPLEFFRAVELEHRSVTEAMSGLKVWPDVLWMRVLEASEGMKFPNGCKWFDYVPFWGDIFPRGKRYYRIRYGKNPWVYHSF